MIRFRCHRCKRPIAAPDGHVGKKVKCPGCMIVTIVPDIPGAKEAKAKAAAASASRAAPPPVPQGPPDPLDELAAAVDGEVMTASFDDEFTTYDQVETFDESFEGDRSPPRTSSRRKVVRKPAADMDVVDVLICVLIPLVGLIIGLLRKNRKSGGQMVGLSLVIMAISFLVGVIMLAVQSRGA